MKVAESNIYNICNFEALWYICYYSTSSRVTRCALKHVGLLTRFLKPCLSSSVCNWLLSSILMFRSPVTTTFLYSFRQVSKSFSRLSKKISGNIVGCLYKFTIINFSHRNVIRQPNIQFYHSLFTIDLKVLPLSLDNINQSLDFNQSLDLYCAIPQLCSWRRTML